MAKPGPAAALDALSTVLKLDSPPRDTRAILIEICLVQRWVVSISEAEERADSWNARFLKRLEMSRRTYLEAGKTCLFEFNSSSPYMLQGATYIEPKDLPEIKEAKLRRRSVAAYSAAIRTISSSDFEALCRGILIEMGVTDPVLTPETSDEGIDFFGQMQLEGNLKHVSALPGLYGRLGVWLVGQAKHYEATQAGTPDIRAVVGAVDLARSKTYSAAKDKYPELALRLCDPVFYLFVTSGSISARGWRLLEASGVIGMDGDAVATFLADHGVSLQNGSFDLKAFEDWIASHRQ